MTEVLALIPARGGSVGVPGKNLRLLGGRPLIAHTIQAARESRLVSRVVVATDSDAIADAAREAGAEVPFRRPAEISHGTSHAFEAYRYSLDWLAEHEDYRPEIVCVLLCTLPFRRATHIDAALTRMIDQGHDWCFSINEFEVHPYRAMVKDGDRIRPLFDVPRSMLWANRQELPPIYRFNGAIIAGRAEHIVNNTEYNIDNGEYGDISVGYLELDRIACWDIDTPEDFEMAQILYGRMQEEGAG